MTKTAAAKAWLLKSWTDSTLRSYTQGAQTADVVQWSVKDPAPGNRDAFFSDVGNDPTSPTDGISQAAIFASNTTLGNTLLAFAVIANDFGTGPDANGNRVSTCKDPVHGDWGVAVGELVANTNDCNCHIKLFVKRNASQLLTTSWSGTGAVAGGVLTLGSGTGPFRLGQRVNSADMPTVDHTGGEVITLSKTSGVLGAAGSTYQLSGGIGSTSFSSEAMTTSDIVNIGRHQTTDNAGTDFSDYPGVFLAEVSGTDGSTTFFSGALQSPSGSVTDSVSAGPLGASGSGLIFGFGFNGGVLGSPTAPAAGTGFTNSHGMLTYDEQGWTGPICTVEWQHFADMTGLAAKFTPHGASNMAAVSVALVDHP